MIVSKDSFLLKLYPDKARPLTDEEIRAIASGKISDLARVGLIRELNSISGLRKRLRYNH